MTRARGFCPRCGERTDLEKTPDRPSRERGLCRSCYLEEHELIDVPEEISVQRCSGCGSYRLDGDWTDSTADLVDIAIDTVARHIRLHQIVEDFDWFAEPTTLDPTTVEVDTEFDLLVEGAYEHRTRTVAVSFESTTCNRCSRIAGKSYASTVQIRADGRTPDKEELSRARSITANILTERVDLGDRDAFLTEVIEREEGLDLRLSTTKLGSKVANAIRDELGGTLDTTSTLVTTDSDGQEVYRTTHAIRIPYVRVDDIIAIDEGVMLIQSVNERIGARHLSEGDIRYLDRSEVEGAVVATRAEAKEATIVSRVDERAVQVIDPTTFEAVTVAHFEGVDLSGETVDSIRVGGTLYLLPSDE